MTFFELLVPSWPPSPLNQCCLDLNFFLFIYWLLGMWLYILGTNLGVIQHWFRGEIRKKSLKKQNPNILSRWLSEMTKNTPTLNHRSSNISKNDEYQCPSRESLGPAQYIAINYEGKNYGKQAYDVTEWRQISPPNSNNWKKMRKMDLSKNSSKMVIRKYCLARNIFKGKLQSNPEPNFIISNTVASILYFGKKKGTRG